MSEQPELNGISHHKTTAELEAQLPEIRQSPGDEGVVGMIVCRPRTDNRKVLQECELTLEEGLVGDNWKQRGHRKTPDGAADTEMQLNLMNLRAIRAICPDQSRWPLAGDQFLVDFDLSKRNLPPGTRLEIGTAVIEVTAEPHLGCRKFSQRFGKDAVMFVNSDEGKCLNARGINARVVAPGRVRVGDRLIKIS